MLLMPDITAGIRNLKKCALLKSVSVDERSKKDKKFCNRFFGKNHVKAVPYQKLRELLSVRGNSFLAKNFQKSIFSLKIFVMIIQL